MPTFVDISDVSLLYDGGSGGGTLALDGATLRIDKGEFVAVVGPSGCGKSTLLKLVSGLNLATRGGIIVADREVSAPLNIVGMAFQNPIMLPWRTTIENVLLPLEIVEPHASGPGAVGTAKRRWSYFRSLVSKGLPTTIPGNSPAACSSARRCAAP
jgi:NitT/TauT family transport system ATP-binding protein